MMYADLLAARDRQWVNERLDTIWRLGGFVLSVRDAVCRIDGVTGRLGQRPIYDALKERQALVDFSDRVIAAGAHSRLYYLPEVDPVTRQVTGGPRLMREVNGR